MIVTADQITQLLLGSNPYEGFPTDQFPADEGDRPEGWGATHWVFEQVLTLSRPNIVIEVGSWKGASAIHMALLCKELDLPATIVCVDTWLGSPEHILKPRFSASLQRRWGFPQLYYSFLANVLKWKCEDLIVPFPNTSENAAFVLGRQGIKADVIYIDAAHEYEPALRDYTAYWELLNDGGYLIGDDYISWEGVTKAANDFSRIVQSQLVGGKKKFLIRKGAEIPSELQRKFVKSERKRLAREAEKADA